MHARIVNWRREERERYHNTGSQHQHAMHKLYNNRILALQHGLSITKVGITDHNKLTSEVTEELYALDFNLCLCDWMKSI